MNPLPLIRRIADVIYAGTWHLPWKTEDGGKTWHNIKKGVIDDSDVFSIVIDRAQPANLFISACSGIYRSDSAGELFRKIQGIPYSARRTRMLQMDPTDHNVVYAGTTEGLWKTIDAGATWKHMTGSNIVINDVLMDPRQSVARAAGHRSQRRAGQRRWRRDLYRFKSRLYPSAGGRVAGGPQ